MYLPKSVPCFLSLGEGYDIMRSVAGLQDAKGHNVCSGLEEAHRNLERIKVKPKGMCLIHLGPVHDGDEPAVDGDDDVPLPDATPVGRAVLLHSHQQQVQAKLIAVVTGVRFSQFSPQNMSYISPSLMEDKYF